MKMQSQLEYKQQEVNGMVHQQPYPQRHQQQHEQQRHQQQQHEQQQRIRVLEPTKRNHRRGPLLGRIVRRNSGPVMQQYSQRYHKDLEESREHVLEPKEFGLIWGVTHELPDDDGEFMLRLLQRPSLADLHEQQQKKQHNDQEPAQQQPGQGKPEQQFKCVEMSRESVELLRFHEPKIRSLMLAHDKAIIFQNIEVQVYVMEELKSEGFRVHFQDKRKTKVSLTYQHFLTFISALPKVDSDFLKYKKKLKMKKTKLRAKGLIMMYP